jgi:death-on-curing protein
VTRYLSLAEFWFLSELVTGIDAATLIRASRVDPADSALHAPQAGFDDTDFYPDVFDKAAVLACRIAWNHLLPDTDHAVEAMLAVAARDVDERWLAGWLRERAVFRS